MSKLICFIFGHKINFRRSWKYGPNGSEYVQGNVCVRCNKILKVFTQIKV